MCHAAVTELLKDDLSPFHCPKDPEQQQEAEAEVVCEWQCILAFKHVFTYVSQPFLQLKFFFVFVFFKNVLSV